LAAYDTVIKMSFEQGVSVAKVGLQRGAALEKLERYPEAIEAYNLVIEKQPNNFDGWLNRGLNLEKMANYEEAVLSYSRAISIWPSNYQAWSQLALMLEKLERLDEAIVAYDKIIFFKTW
jgi:Putative Zn-dependent protease, contains TPR repeats